MSIVDSEVGFKNALVAFNRKSAYKKKELDISRDSLANSNILYDIDVEEV